MRVDDSEIKVTCVGKDIRREIEGQSPGRSYGVFVKNTLLLMHNWYIAKEMATLFDQGLSPKQTRLLVRVSQ